MSLSVVGSQIVLGHGEVGLSSRPTCMIVEDQALIGLSLEAYLEETGFDVGEPFSSASEALAWLATHTPTIAILDYSLKDGPCTMLMRTLQGRGIPFVVYSGHRRCAAPELQSVPWITKPCDREVLLAALRSAAPALAAWNTPEAV